MCLVFPEGPPRGTSVLVSGRKPWRVWISLASRGTMIEIQLVSARKTVPVGVTGRDSPAGKQQGFHFYFMTAVRIVADNCRQPLVTIFNCTIFRIEYMKW